MADAKNIKLWFSPEAMATPGTGNSLLLNDSARKVAVIFQATNTEPITEIFVPHTSTTGTSPTYLASLQSINTSGQPSGTVLGGGSPASVTFSPTSLGYAATRGYWVTLANAYTPTRGEFLAVVIEYSSGTVNGSNFSSIRYYFSGPDFGMPHAVDYQASWTKRSGQPALAYKTATRVYGFPCKTTISQSYTSTTEYGLKFTIPSGWFGTYKLAGVEFMCTLPAASTYSAKLYDGGGASDTTVLASLTGADGDFSGSGNRPHRFLFADATLPTLTAGSTYRISLAAGGAVSTTLYLPEFESNADMSGMPLGINSYLTTRSGGNWTDTDTRILYGALVFSEITGSSGSTGIPIARGMHGGMR